jgi:uncharacterized iron-regulated protein
MPTGYANALGALFVQAHRSASGTPPQNMPSPANMKAAQALWDATMADTVARFRRTHRDTLVVHVNGSMHSDHGWGIVDRSRRLTPRARVAVVSLKPYAAYATAPAGKLDGVADYVIITPAKAAAIER